MALARQLISVILPAHDEETAIGETIRGVQALESTHDLTCELVVVDDGSSDSSARVAAEHGAVVVRHPYSLGYGNALKHGIEVASHDTIVIMDADGTYRAADIPGLLEAYAQGVDMVVGVRSLGTVRETIFKRALRAMLTFLVEFTVGRRVPDVNSGLRVFSRQTVQPHLSRLCGTFSFTTSLTLAYVMTGRFVAYVPVGYLARVGRSKVRLLRDMLRTMQYIVEAIVYFNPIKIFLLVAAMSLSGALVIGALLLAVDVRAAALAGVVGFVGALIIFAIGLAADLLRQITSK